MAPGAPFCDYFHNHRTGPISVHLSAQGRKWLAIGRFHRGSVRKRHGSARSHAPMSLALPLLGRSRLIGALLLLSRQLLLLLSLTRTQGFGIH
jgi:hypothetical protein